MPRTIVEILGKDRSGPAFESLKRRLDDTDRGIAGVSKQMASLGSVVRTVAGVFASLKVGQLVTEVAGLSQSYGQFGVVMEAVGKNAGISRGELDRTATAIQKLGISMLESRSTITKLVSANIDLSNATGLARAAQDAAVIGQINSSEALSRMVHGLVSGQVEVLKGIGINVNFAQSYKAISEELGKTVTDLTEAEKMQARLNVVFKAAEGNVGSYEASMNNAGKQLGSTTRLVEDLGVKVGGLFDSTSLLAVSTYKSALEDLHQWVDRLVSSGTIQAWGDSLAMAFATAADAGGVLLRTVKQIASVQLRPLLMGLRGDFSGALAEVKTQFSLVSEVFNDTDSMRRKLGDQIFNRNIQTAKSFEWASNLPQVLEMASVALDGVAEATGKTGNAAKKAETEQERFVRSLTKQVNELGKGRFELLRMEAAQLNVLDVTESMIDQLEREEIALQDASGARDNYLKWLRENADITESVMTAHEKYAAVRADLMSRFETGGISEDTLNRKLREVEGQLLGLEGTARRTFDSMDQFAIQAARNIQSAFANYFFDPFERGMKGLVTGMANAVRRMVAELAAVKVTQGLGIGAMLGLGSSGAMAAGGGIDMFNLASMGSTLANAFSNGLGVTGMAGSAVTALGNTFGSAAISSFGAGMTGGSAAATFIGAESAAAGAGMAANMGATFAAGANLLAAGGLGVLGGSLLAGDKKIAGINGTISSVVGAAIGAAIAGPVGAAVGGVLGGAVNAMFGRGPLKQRDTVLSGQLGAEGFESGGLRTNFRAKGGLFRSNKKDFVSVDAQTGEISTDNRKLSEFAEGLSTVARDIIGLFNETASGVSLSLRDIAGNLKLSTDGLDAFSREIRLVSENGEFLTDEQIATEIHEISQALANSLLPGLDQFAMRGETALQVITRLNAEFNVLSTGALILGKSVAESRAMIDSLSFDRRSSFVNAAGGLEALAQKADFFAQNFLDDAERLQPAIEILSDQMRELGLSADITREDFRDLVQSYGELGGISGELFQALLNIAPLFVRVKDGLDALVPELDDGANAARALADAERLITDRRSGLLTAYQREGDELRRLAERYDSLALTLRSASDGLALSQLSPLTPAQRLDEARLQFNRDRAAAMAGDPQAASRLVESSRAFLEASQTFNASSAEYVSDFNLVKRVLESVAVSAETEADITRRQLTALDSTVSQLTDINAGVISVETAVRELIEAVLQGPGNAAISPQDIRDFVNQPGRTTQEVINEATRRGVSGNQIGSALGMDRVSISQASGGMSISDAAIKEFFHTNLDNPRLIYDTAKQMGLTLSRVASAAGFSYNEIEKWAKANNLPMFERGTNFVQKGGLAMLHPAEAVTPANHMKDMAQQIAMLRQEVAQLRREQNEQTGALINVAMRSQETNARLIIESNQDMAKSANWREQARAALR